MGAASLSVLFTLNLLCLERCLALGRRLYSFPRAAVMKCHKLDGLKQQDFTLTVPEVTGAELSPMF